MPRPTIPGRDAVISVSVVDDVVVLRPHGDLDRATTGTLVGLVGAATGCGTIAAIVLDGQPLAPVSPISSVSSVDGAVSSADRRHGGVDTVDTVGAVDIVGPGRVRLCSESRHWTFDLVTARMFTSDRPVDWRFVGPGSWTPIRGLWASASRVAVRTDGGIVSIPAGWRSSRGQHPLPMPPTPFGERAPRRIPAA